MMSTNGAMPEFVSPPTGVSDAQPDPTLVRNQPSLTTSNGGTWLIVGGMFATIACVVLGFLLPLQPAGLALASIIAIVVLYVAMIVVRFRVVQPRRRLGWLATLMLTMAVISLASTIVVSIAEWDLL
jgi:hypothetical protein